MQIKLFYLTALYFVLSSGVYAQEVLQWRGPDRTGICDESNLLKSWPEAGP